MAVRSHVDFFVTLTPALVLAVSAEEGRRVSRDETAARLTRELRGVAARWAAYGEWVERVESGAWLLDYQRRQDIAAHVRPRGRRSFTHSAASRSLMAAAMRASWARRKACEASVA